ncbi:hypothetical protein [Streptomyces sp. TLI_171]|uniref:hypothetical protein n=1 Tax=Streptomyces sp. TLI_171 TaxID=1938859 RepID=UPI000C18BD66|nr:hypothetical protein [Streptomyces sp. TLI_171]RKE20166.1 hypothetical protein BX266_3515 [Streptomyces sp. TLI_171]
MPAVSRPALRHVLTHLVTPLLMCLGMGVAYLSAFHAPAPHHLKVAVVGPAAQAQPLARALQDKAGDGLDVTTVAGPDAARQQLLDRDLVAAYVPDAAAPTLLVATASSETSATAAEKVFTQVAAHQGKPLAVQELTPLPAGDPTGQGLFFLLVALSIGSYGSVAVLGAAGAALTMRVRALLGLGVALVVSLLGAALAGPMFHLVEHGLLGTWAMSWLYAAGIVAIGTALHTWLGRWNTLTVMALFVMLNFTSSGGIFEPALQNGFFGALHSFWNGAGLLEGVRDHVYFGGRAGFGGHLVTLFGWLAAGAALLVLAARTEHRRARPAAVEPAEEEEMAEAVGV